MGVTDRGMHIILDTGYLSSSPRRGADGLALPNFEIDVSWLLKTTRGLEACSHRVRLWQRQEGRGGADYQFPPAMPARWNGPPAVGRGAGGTTGSLRNPP